MSFKPGLIVALALVLLPAAGCREKSNTTEQNQSNTTAPATGSAAATGSDTNPHQPNPSGAAQGTPMGSAAVAPGPANTAPSDAGVDGGAGAAGAGTGGAGAGGTGAGSAAGGTR